MKPRILFLSMHSVRNQMAHAFLKKLAENRFEIHSAGVEPNDKLTPVFVQVMGEVGIDFSLPHSQKFSELSSDKHFQYVITLFDNDSVAECPIVPHAQKRLYWEVHNPYAVNGSTEEKLNKLREIRDEIKLKVENWVKDIDEQVKGKFSPLGLIYLFDFNFWKFNIGDVVCANCL